jgi:uncharacterized membrane-anchored protein
MSQRKRVAFVVIVALQLLALLGLIAARIHLLRSGQRVLLKCEPVDPRSILSGDYVRLNFVISSFSAEEVERLDVDRRGFLRNETVYVGLTRSASEKYHRAGAISRDAARLRRRFPVVLRGTVVDDLRPAWRQQLSLRYGVEEYFVPQYEGRRIERQMRDAAVEVAVGASGESAIRRLFIGGQEVRFY